MPISKPIKAPEDYELRHGCIIDGVCSTFTMKVAVVSLKIVSILIPLLGWDAFNLMDFKLVILKSLTAYMLLPPKVPVFLSFGFWETVECLEHHLKHVIFHRYKDRRAESEFARYLLSNEKVLKEMKLHVPKGCNRSSAEMEKKPLGSKTVAPFGTRIIWQELDNLGGAFYFYINASNWSRVDPLMDML